MTLPVPHLPFSLDPLIAEAKRRMRRRRGVVATVLLLLAGIAAAAVVVARSPGGPRPTGSPGGPLGTAGQAVEHAFDSRGLALTPVAALPELCDPSVCTGLVLWGGAKPAYLVPQHGRDFAVIVFRTAADARRIGAFEQKHAPTLGADARGSALLVYLSSSSRIASLKAAFAAVR